MSKIAESGLRYGKDAIDLAMQNAATARIAGSTVKLSTPTAVIQGGKVSDLRNHVSRDVDPFALQTARSAGAITNYYDTIKKNIEPIQDFVGSLEKGALPRLQEPIRDFFAEVNKVITKASDSSEKSVIVEAGKKVANIINQTVTTCFEAKQTVEQQLTSEIASLNNFIHQLAILNRDIESQAAAQNDVTDLEDQRDTLVTEISSLIMVDQPRITANKGVMLSTAGRIIVNGSQYASFTYTPSPTFTAIEDGKKLGIITYNKIDLLSGQMLTKPTDLSNQFYNSDANQNNIPNGSIKAYADLYDTIIPKYVAALDSLAFNVAESVNKIHNSGSPYPGRESILGSKSVTLLDQSTWTGKATIAVVDGKGRPVTSGANDTGYVASPLNLDLKALSGLTPTNTLSVQDIVSEINAHFGMRTAIPIAMGQQGTDLKYLLNDFQLVAHSSNTNEFSFDFEAFNTSDFNANIEILSVDMGGANLIGSLPDMVTVNRGELKRTFQTVNVNTSALAGNQDVAVKVRVAGTNGVVNEGVIHFTINVDALPNTNQRVAGTIQHGGDEGNFTEAPMLANNFIKASVVDDQGFDVLSNTTSGYVSLKTTDSNYHIIMQDDNSSTSTWVDGFGANRRGLSGYFGFNDFFTMTEKVGKYAKDMAVRDDIVNDTVLFSNTRLAPGAAKQAEYSIGTSAATNSVAFAPIAGPINLASYNDATISVAGVTYTLTTGPVVANPIDISTCVTANDILVKVASSFNSDNYLKNLVNFSVNGNDLIMTSLNKGSAGNNIGYRMISQGDNIFNAAIDTALLSLEGGQDAVEKKTLSPLGLSVASGYTQLYADLIKLDQQGISFVTSKLINYSFGKISNLAQVVGSFMNDLYDMNKTNLDIQKSSLSNLTDAYKAAHGFDRDQQTIEVIELQNFISSINFAISTYLQIQQDILRALSGR